MLRLFSSKRKDAKIFEYQQALSCWYSLDSSCGVHSDEYPYTRVSVIFSRSLHYFVLTKLASNSIRVKVLFRAWIGWEVMIYGYVYGGFMHLKRVNSNPIIYCVHKKALFFWDIKVLT